MFVTVTGTPADLGDMCFFAELTTIHAYDSVWERLLLIVTAHTSIDQSPVVCSSLSHTLFLTFYHPIGLKPQSQALL